VADLGLHPGGSDHHLSSPPGDRSVHVGHGGAVPQGHVRTGHRSSVFADRKALPGQGGFLDLQRRRDCDPAIGRHQVSRLHQHYVARHQFGGVDLEHLAIPANPGDGLHHRGKGGDALLGLGLLAKTDHRIEDREPGEEHRGRGITGHQLVDRRRHQKHDLHEVLVLAEKGPEPRLLLPLGETIHPVLRHTFFDLGAIETALRVHLEGEGHLGRFHGVPVGALTHLCGHRLPRRR